MIKKYFLGLSVLLLGYQLKAQDSLKTQPESIHHLRNEKIATGFIKDGATRKPLESVRVSYGDIFAAITDSTGRFSIKVPGYNVAIRISADGYQAKEVALKGNNSVSVVLYEADYPSFYAETTTPFGVIPKSQSTIAATTIQSKGNWNTPAETPDAYLQGKVAGLNVIRRSGTANIGANLSLRGFSSLYATNQPLYIVDGVLFENSNGENALATGYYNNPLSFIDIKDIDNITVIKDGSSTYGAKGANGVILITTARARQEATRIDAGIYGGVNFAPANIPVMNAGDYRTFLAEMLQSKGMSYAAVKALPYMNDDTANPNYFRYHANNNWQDIIFRNSYTQNGYLKITGGDNIAKYGLSIGFLKSAGNVKETDLSRYNMRFNADLNLSKRLTAAANLSFIYNDQNLKNFGINTSTNPIYSALIKAPFLPTNELADNGVASPTLAGADSFKISNPAALTDLTLAANKSSRFVGAVNFNYLLTNNFSFGTTIAVTVDKIRETFFIPETGVVNDTLDNAIARNRSGASVIRMFNIYNDTKLAYNKVFNSIHKLSARLGMRYTKTNSERDFGLGFNSATDKFTGVGFGVNSLRQIGGSIGEYAWINTYLSADYGLSGKYFLTFNMATDASSRFGVDSYRSSSLGFHLGENSYAVFPSLAASWLVSSENFMADNNFIELFKIRASAGMTGNDDIGNFTSKKYYVSNNLLGISGLVRGNIGNPELQHEAVTKLNAGLDLSVLHERLSITADVYRNTTDKMIVYEPLPTSSGFEYRVTNSGGMKTTGWEITLNGRIINTKNLKWDAGFNVSNYRSVVTKLPVNNILTSFADGTVITSPGSAPNLFYGYKTNGVYTSDAEAAAEGLSIRKADGSLAPFKGGDVRFVNADASNKVIDEKDMQVIGNPNPDLFGGITTRVAWNNLSLDALLSFTSGNDVYNYTRRELESMIGYANQTEAVLNRWRTNGQVTNVPKATWGDPMGNSRFSDRWIEDGSYLRLRTVSLTYNVPLKAGFVKSASVYIIANNMFTFTKYLGYDPEFSATLGVAGQGVDETLEPQYRSAQIGVRLGL